MARERYLIEHEESSIHSNVITLNTKKEKFQNWWLYNKGAFFLILAGVAFLVYALVSVFTKVEPDYSIAFMYSTYIETDVLDAFGDYLEEYADDRNDDGQVVVQVYSYCLDTDYDSTAEEVAYVQMAADFMLGTSMIWVHDESGWLYMDGDEEGSFVELEDDSTPTVVSFYDVAVFADFDFSSSGVDYPVYYENYFQNLSVSVRENYGAISSDEETVEYCYDSYDYFMYLLNGAE
ncbi:MAG: hypothetical protein R3Y35_05795 [Clostridia bacterium]